MADGQIKLNVNTTEATRQIEQLSKSMQTITQNVETAMKTMESLNKLMAENKSVQLKGDFRSISDLLGKISTQASSLANTPHSLVLNPGVVTSLQNVFRNIGSSLNSVKTVGSGSTIDNAAVTKASVEVTEAISKALVTSKKVENQGTTPLTKEFENFVNALSSIKNELTTVSSTINAYNRQIENVAKIGMNAGKAAIPTPYAISQDTAVIGNNLINKNHRTNHLGPNYLEDTYNQIESNKTEAEKEAAKSAREAALNAAKQRAAIEAEAMEWFQQDAKKNPGKKLNLDSGSLIHDKNSNYHYITPLSARIDRNELDTSNNIEFFEKSERNEAEARAIKESYENKIRQAHERQDLINRENENLSKLMAQEEKEQEKALEKAKKIRDDSIRRLGDLSALINNTVVNSIESKNNKKISSYGTYLGSSTPLSAVIDRSDSFNGNGQSVMNAGYRDKLDDLLLPKLTAADYERLNKEDLQKKFDQMQSKEAQRREGYASIYDSKNYFASKITGLNNNIDERNARLIEKYGDKAIALIEKQQKVTVKADKELKKEFISGNSYDIKNKNWRPNTASSKTLDDILGRVTTVSGSEKPVSELKKYQLETDRRRAAAYEQATTAMQMNSMMRFISGGDFKSNGSGTSFFNSFLRGVAGSGSGLGRKWDLLNGNLIPSATSNVGYSTLMGLESLKENVGMKLRERAFNQALEQTSGYKDYLSYMQRKGKSDKASVKDFRTHYETRWDEDTQSNVETKATKQIKTYRDRALQDLNQDEKSLKKISNSSLAFSLIAGTVVTAIGSVGSALTNLTKQSIDSFSQIQSLQTQLSVVYGSATDSRAAFGSIETYAKKSPFGVDVMTQQAILLKQSGVYSSDLMDTMAHIGDMASGNAQKMQSISETYARILSSTTVTARDMRQLANAGVPAYKALAESMKKNGASMYDFDKNASAAISSNQIRSMLQSGKVSSKDFQNMIEYLTTNGGLFEGAVNKGAKTLLARKQNLSDAKQMALASWGEYFTTLGGTNTNNSFYGGVLNWLEKIWNTEENRNRITNDDKKIKDAAATKAEYLALIELADKSTSKSTKEEYLNRAEEIKNQWSDYAGSSLAAALDKYNAGAEYKKNLDLLNNLKAELRVTADKQDREAIKNRISEINKKLSELDLASGDGVYFNQMKDNKWAYTAYELSNKFNGANTVLSKSIEDPNSLQSIIASSITKYNGTSYGQLLQNDKKYKQNAKAVKEAEDLYNTTFVGKSDKGNNLDLGRLTLDSYNRARELLSSNQELFSLRDSLSITGKGVTDTGKENVDALAKNAKDLLNSINLSIDDENNPLNISRNSNLYKGLTGVSNNLQKLSANPDLLTEDFIEKFENTMTIIFNDIDASVKNGKISKEVGEALKKAVGLLSTKESYGLDQVEKVNSRGTHFRNTVIGGALGINADKVQYNGANKAFNTYANNILQRQTFSTLAKSLMANGKQLGDLTSQLERTGTGFDGSNIYNWGSGMKSIEQMASETSLSTRQALISAYDQEISSLENMELAGVTTTDQFNELADLSDYLGTAFNLSAERLSDGSYRYKDSMLQLAEDMKRELKAKKFQEELSLAIKTAARDVNKGILKNNITSDAYTGRYGEKTSDKEGYAEYRWGLISSIMENGAGGVAESLKKKADNGDKNVSELLTRIALNDRDTNKFNYNSNKDISKLLSAEDNKNFIDLKERYRWAPEDERNKKVNDFLKERNITYSDGVYTKKTINSKYNSLTLEDSDIIKTWEDAIEKGDVNLANAIEDLIFTIKGEALTFEEYKEQQKKNKVSEDKKKQDKLESDYLELMQRSVIPLTDAGVTTTSNKDWFSSIGNEQGLAGLTKLGQSISYEDYKGKKRKIGTRYLGAEYNTDRTKQWLKGNGLDESLYYGDVLDYLYNQTMTPDLKAFANTSQKSENYSTTKKTMLSNENSVALLKQYQGNIKGLDDGRLLYGIPSLSDDYKIKKYNQENGTDYTYSSLIKGVEDAKSPEEIADALAKINDIHLDNLGLDVVSRQFNTMIESAENFKDIMADTGKAMLEITEQSALSGMLSQTEKMGEAWYKTKNNIETSEEAQEELTNALKQSAAQLVGNLSNEIASAGLSVIKAGADEHSWSKVGLGMAMVAAGGIGSMFSGYLNADSEDSSADDTEAKLAKLKEDLLDLIEQAKKDAIYYETTMSDKRAIQTNADASYYSVNDMILTPQGVFSTSPEDYLIATKNPQALASSQSYNSAPQINFSFVNNSGTELGVEESSTSWNGSSYDIEVVVNSIVQKGMTNGDYDDTFSAVQSRQKGRVVSS